MKEGKKEQTNKVRNDLISSYASRKRGRTCERKKVRRKGRRREKGAKQMGMANICPKALDMKGPLSGALIWLHWGHMTNRKSAQLAGSPHQ